MGKKTTGISYKFGISLWVILAIINIVSIINFNSILIFNLPSIPLKVNFGPLPFSITFIIFGALSYYANRTFKKKSDIKKAILKFRVAYCTSWILSTLLIINNIVYFLHEAKNNPFAGIIVILNFYLALICITYAIAFMVISSKLKKR